MTFLRPIIQVVIDQGEHKFYSGYFDGERGSWEILRASYDTPIILDSFFRTNLQVWNSEDILKCSKNGGHSYFQVDPRSFVLDDGEFFVSWDGFYQNCSDDFAAKRGLQWSIGVSKILQSPDCVLTGGLEPVNFEDCTEPVSIVYQDATAREVVHGYSGIAVSRSLSGKRIFYLSIIEIRSGVEVAFSEIWTMPEGEYYSKNPKASGAFGAVRISKEFLEHAVDDVGTIRLRVDNSGIPTAACRSAYDAGVFCYALEVLEDSTIKATGQNQYVSREVLAERCTVKSPHYSITEILPPVSTGLEVLWADDSPDTTPAMLFFGCYGEISGMGNFTTVLADGTVQETVHGAHPGTILFGVNVAASMAPKGDYIPPTNGTPLTSSPREKSFFSHFAGLLVMTCLAVTLLSRGNQLKRYISRYKQYHLVQDDMDPMPTSSYVELV